ncbi:sensor histidine kinase [Flavilitoribacter nigricans]|uniref:histidine kinase n=1 Tax=Flavilitoribacter nigricans (strain ATCC 23147 / DSM 23189 / NBRC 102662 / NCIMB 1420 / SS-2) TaxID=1122177 RepID=A0A2D0NAV8_FLAN2|nr:ATP-binding protein [Flavilitoribacter nigricans]PHN04903.1 histidine kinase [Flavilitoribacter nigricans DSM 23189 = NBRC 102662]
MTLRSKYILFITLIHLVALVMSFLIFEEQKLWFILSEGILLISLYFAIRLYRELVQPIGLLSRGMDALQDRDFNVKFQPTGQIETDKLISVYNQMVDRLREERTAQVQQHFFLDKLISTSPVGTIILDFEEHIATLNPRAEQFLGLTQKQAKGKKLDDLNPELAGALAQLAPDSSETFSIDGIATFKCHKAHFIDRGFPHYFITIEDLTTEKLRIEKQAYGKVIRMMAHEVNNSIGPINSILESLLHYDTDLPEGERSTYREVIEVARDRNQRLNVFMRNFADVIRLPPARLERQDIRPLLQQVTTLMQYQTEERRIEWRQELPDKPVILAIDKEQLEQVLINIIKNAIEAIEREGTIIIRLDRHSLQVIDNGIGLPPRDDGQLFSPFFSTKSQGQGVGLTLSKEILINHHFTFSLRTAADGQTVFSIQFG